MAKPILCLDFDGVIHSYASGWLGATAIPDPPVHGALGFLRMAVEHFTVAIYSSRSGQPGGVEAMKAWLEACVADETGACPNWILGLVWPTSKPPAFVTIDDRAITFTGAWPSMEELHGFRPWNKKA